MHEREERLLKAAHLKGYKLYRNFPDYLLLKGDEIIFVEVKAYSGDNLSPGQITTFEALEKFVKVRISIDGDLETLYTVDEYLNRAHVGKTEPIPGLWSGRLAYRRSQILLKRMRTLNLLD